MRGTADRAGRSLRGAIAGGLALVCAGALALQAATPFEIDAGSVALAAVAVALLGLAAVQRDIGRSRAHGEKVSEELDTLAQTLLRIEGTLAALDGSGTKAKSTLNDVAGDVHSLSQVVKSLAETMAAHDREIGTLKRRGAAEPILTYRMGAGPDLLATAPAPMPTMVPSFLPARDAATAALSEVLPVAAAMPAPVQRRTSGTPGILSAALAGEIDLHAQPIVNLPQRRERIYEVFALLQGEQTEPLLPAQYMPVLAKAGNLPDFEAGLVTRALVFGHRLASAGSDARICVALSGASLADRGFMRRLDALVEDHEAASRRLVLEVSQEDWKSVAAESDTFGRLRRNGVLFALTAITDENLNPPALARLGVRYVRLDAKRLMAAIDGGGVGADIVTLVTALQRSGVEVVSDGVEDDVIVPELIDIGVPLAQGIAFALPSPAESILEQPRRAPGQSKPAAAPEPPKPDGSGPPHGSLRDFLRRAG